VCDRRGRGRRRLEAVALAVHRVDVAMSAAVDLGAQPLDGAVHRLRGRRRRVLPHVDEELLAAHRLPRARGEVGQDVPLLGREVHVDAANHAALLREIDVAVCQLDAGGARHRTPWRRRSLFARPEA
jgi:hypothetical protein